MAPQKVSNEYLNQKLDYAIEKIGVVDTKINGVYLRLDKDYITKDYFELRIQPLEQSKKIVFGFIVMVLVAVASTIIGLYTLPR